MTHAQNSPRGLFQKGTGNFTTLTVGTFSGTITAATITTATITTAVVTTLDIGATGLIQLTSPAAKILALESTATKPAVDRGVAIAALSNSTGVSLMINSTGTTWKYLLTTAVQPT